MNDIYRGMVAEDSSYLEEKSNRHVIKSLYWLIFACLFTWFLVMMRAFVIDQTLSTYACIGSVIILCVTVLCCRDRKNLWHPAYKYVLLAVIAVVVGLLCSLLTYHAVLLYVLPLTFAVQYRRTSVLWYAYVLTLVSLVIGCYVGYYYGMCDLNLLIASGGSSTHYFRLIDNGQITLPINDNINFIIGVYQVLPQAAILFIFTNVLRVTSLQQNEDVEKIRMLTNSRDRDNRTKLYNKGKFEEMLGYYYPNIDRVAVIFWDMNNLKKTNDELGHAVGDKLIGYMADSINSAVNKVRRAYRIGGDEFVMVIENPSIGEPDNIIAQVQEKIVETNEKSDIPGLSAAVGWAIGDGNKVRDVVKKADANMYLNKQMSKRGRE